jgi:L-fuculose-phosphate aldolase
VRAQHQAALGEQPCVAAARRVAAEGLVLGTAGNVSARAGEIVAVTPTGAVLAELEPDHVVVVDLEGRTVQGDYAPTSEIELHLGAYRRYQVGAVVHAHSPVGTALACVLDELPLVHYQMLGLGGPIRVAPYATFGTPELAQLTLDALEGRAAALMANRHAPGARRVTAAMRVIALGRDHAQQTPTRSTVPS